MSTIGDAYLLIATFEAAIINGCRHYDGNGNLLSTARDIVEYISKGGSVEIDTICRVEKITVEEQLKIVVARYNN